MTAHRVEITLPDDVWERLELARGHEARASFVKRALESALDFEARLPASSQWEDVEAHKAVHRDFARAAGSESRPDPAILPSGVKTARELAMVRQRRLNEEKS